jgi:hypothetical protein
MAITLRSGKGSALTHSELDANFSELLSGQHLQAPSAAGNGLRLGPDRAYGWHDLTGNIHFHDDALDAPSVAMYVGNIHQHKYCEGNSGQVSYHLPHDYAQGTNIYIHAHWSHNATNVTGGSVTWAFELTYAKGHNQMAFALPVTIMEQQPASTIQCQHMVCEALASTPGGAANLLDTNLLEPDGLIFGRIFMFSDDITVSGGDPACVFLHEVDIHYQSTGISTLNRQPNFYG